MRDGEIMMRIINNKSTTTIEVMISKDYLDRDVQLMYPSNPTNSIDTLA